MCPTNGKPASWQDCEVAELFVAAVVVASAYSKLEGRQTVVEAYARGMKKPYSSRE